MDGSAEDRRLGRITLANKFYIYMRIIYKKMSEPTPVESEIKDKLSDVVAGPAKAMEEVVVPPADASKVGGRRRKSRKSGGSKKRKSKKRKRAKKRR